ncbi:MAG TPA: DUF3800 domain-containing protein [Rhizomicrobium sp.]|nr:DUF3800 domain-containing protein [Rhizomicrobium sp.]
MTYVSPRELIAPFLWVGQRGLQVMFQGYFDDSGTHDGSRIAVWGGLIGPSENFDQLDRRWRALLARPLEGKPPLKKFSLAKCINGEGEFSSYNQADRDLVRRRFREAIIETDVAALAYIVYAEDWEQILTARDKEYMGKAQNICFKSLLQDMTKYAVGENEHVGLYFDAGQQGLDAKAILYAWGSTHPEFNEKVSVTFSAVASLTGLQAADIVAGEAYRHGLHLKDPKKHPTSAHFEDFTARQNTLFAILDGDAIRKMMVKWRIKMRSEFGIAV